MKISKLSARRMALFALTIILIQAFVPIAPTKAATANTLYSYQFGKSTVSIQNDAVANTGTPLKIQGSVTTSANGNALYFDGNTVNKSSVGYAKPASGPTMTASANESYGASIKFTHTLVAGQTCFYDSHNYTQVGRFGTGLSQLKIQASNCHTNSRAVFPECRIAASDNSTSAPILRGTQALINGATYIVSCIKAPDTDGKSSVILTTTRLDATGPYTVTNTVQIQAAGAFYSDAWLSVANKYALPKQSDNTDQVVGDIYHVTYCKASATYAVQACLDSTNLVTPTPDPTPTPTPDPTPTPTPDPTPTPTPDPTPTPTPTPDPYPVPTLTQFVQNTGIESTISGWNKVWGSNVAITRDSTVARSGASSLKATYTGSGSENVGIKDAPFTVEKSLKGKEYTATVWVRGSTNNKSIELRLREMSGVDTVSSIKTVVVASNTGWTKHTASITPIKDGSSISFAITSFSNPTSSTFWADDFSLTASN